MSGEILNSAFFWVGVGTVLIIVIGALLIALASFYALFVHDRFNMILFRRGERRLSIASWYNGKLMQDEDFAADDWPVNKRPFYFSYRIGQRRLFVLLGLLGPHRHMPIKGKHPEDSSHA